MAVSFQCMTKSTTIKKKNDKKFFKKCLTLVNPGSQRQYLLFSTENTKGFGFPFWSAFHFKIIFV